MEYTPARVAGMIDHAVLAPGATTSDIDAGCDLCAELQTASVCVMPCWVERAARRLEGSGAAVCTVIGFPSGATHPAVKHAESKLAIEGGAAELDMVVNRGLLRSGGADAAKVDIESVLQAASGKARVKVIFECSELEDEEKRQLSLVCSESFAQFDMKPGWVKTSTGFASGGATEADVKLMLDHVFGAVEVKASGGIRDFAAFKRFADLGCTRIGCSATRAIVEQAAGLDTAGPSSGY